MSLLIQYTLIFAAVLLLVALGGCFSEHSGVINIGLEGIMVMGALGGALVMKFLPYTAGLGFFEDFKMFACVLLGAVAAGVIYSLFLAVPCISFKADQTIVGTALNLLGTALATVIVKSMNTAISPDDHSSDIYFIEARKAFTTDIVFEHTENGIVTSTTSFELNWFVIVTVILLVVSIVLLYKTRFGLRLRACGEHPQAADSVGINVYKMRYWGVLISGFLGGLGGLVYISAGATVWKFENGVAGFGFLALAVMIFGAWKPQRIALAALLFGLFRSLSNVNQGIPFLANMKIPSNVYLMLPYIVSLIILAVSSKNSHAPKAEGIPYDKGSR